MIKLMLTLLFSFFVCPNTLLASDLNSIDIFTEEYPPYNYRGKSGELQGVAVTLLENAYLHAKVSFDKNKIQLRPWPRTYRNVLVSPNTMLFSMTRTKEREKLFKWAGPISKTKVVLLAKRSNKIVISSVNDLSKYIVGGIRNDIGLTLARDLIVNNGQFRAFSSASAIAKMLNIGRVDLWAYEENVAKHFLKGLNLDLDDFEVVYTLSEAELFFAFNEKTDQNIVDGLQRVLDNYRQASSSN
jgi:ABC-type amino acid transport substrate-binding protein